MADFKRLPKEFTPLAELLDRCLNREPNERPADFTVVLKDLDALAADLTPQSAAQRKKAEEELARLQAEGEPKFRHLLRDIYDRRRGKPTKEDSDIANTLTREYRIPKERAEAIVREIRVEWRAKQKVSPSIVSAHPEEAAPPRVETPSEEKKTSENVPDSSNTGLRPAAPPRPPKRAIPMPKLTQAAIEGKAPLRTLSELAAFFAGKEGVEKPLPTPPLNRERIRVYLLARELDIDTSDLLRLCLREGYDVKNQLSSLDAVQQSRLVEAVRKLKSSGLMRSIRSLPEHPSVIESGMHALDRENAGDGDLDDSDLDPEASCISEALPLAHNGDADAQYRLAKMFLHGDIDDVPSAIAWFSEAARQGHQEAVNAWRRYSTDNSREQWDTIDRRSDGELGLEDDDLDAEQRIHDDFGTELNLAHAGDADAQFRVAMVLLSPEVNDVESAVCWLQLAAKQGHENASKELNDIFGHGLDEVADWEDEERRFRPF
jgi:hypothetical protein